MPFPDHAYKQVPKSNFRLWNLFLSVPFPDHAYKPISFPKRRKTNTCNKDVLKGTSEVSQSLTEIDKLQVS